MKDLRFGQWTQQLPGYLGHCDHCETSWAFVPQHLVRVSPYCQVACLCQHCHAELSVEQRRLYYALRLPYWTETGQLTPGQEIQDRLNIFKAVSRGA